jgi:Predicted permeases
MEEYLPYLQYVAVFVVSLLGTAVQAASGFGYGIFVMSVLPHFLPYNVALCTTGLVAIPAALRIAWRYRRDIDIRLVAVPVIVYLGSSLIGTMFLKSLGDAVLRRILGGFLILLSIYMFRFSERIRVKAGIVSGTVAGGLGGILGSVFSMGGPPIVIYMLAAAARPEVYMASTQLYFFSTNVYLGFVRFFNGMMSEQVIYAVIAGFLGIFGGARLGDALFRRLDIVSLRRMVYAFMVLMGLMFLLGG